MSLTYKAKPTFQTSLGGAVAILGKLGVLAYFLSLVNSITNKEKATIFKNVFKGANNNNQTAELSTDTFDFAVGLSFYDG